MPKFSDTLTAVGRNELLETIDWLSEENKRNADEITKLKADCRNKDANIRDLQAQLEKFGNGLDGILLKGWMCRACGIFNGEMKEKRSDCRACGMGK